MKKCLYRYLKQLVNESVLNLMSVMHPLFIRRMLRDRHLCYDTVLNLCLEEQKTNITRYSTGVKDKSLGFFKLNFCQISNSDFWKSQFTSPGVIYLEIQWLILLINNILRINVFDNKLFLWGNGLKKSCHWLSKWPNLHDSWTMFWNLIRKITLVFTLGK